MRTLLIFWLMTAACCAFACCFGGRTGLVGALILAVKTISGFWAGLLDQTWTHVSIPVLVVDIMAFLAFTWLALKSDEYWPLWAAGFALAAIAVHLAAAIHVGFRPAVYHGIKGLIVLPMEVMIMLGIYLDRRCKTSDRFRQGF